MGIFEWVLEHRTGIQLFKPDCTMQSNQEIATFFRGNSTGGSFHPRQKSCPGSLLLRCLDWRAQVGHIESVRCLHLLKSDLLSLGAFEWIVVPVGVAFLCVVAAIAR